MSDKSQSFIQIPSRTHVCSVEHDAHAEESVVLEPIPTERGILSFFRDVRCVFCGETWADRRVYG